MKYVYPIADRSGLMLYRPKRGRHQQASYIYGDGQGISEIRHDSSCDHLKEVSLKIFFQETQPFIK